MELEQIVAMAVAVIAEENSVEPKHVIVYKFAEVQQNGLQKYLAENNISYHKYQLGE